MRLLLLLVIVLTIPARADVGIFVPSLLNPRFPVDDIIDLKPNAVAVLAKSFGSKWSNLERVSPHVKTVILYLDCGPCRDPRRPKGQFSVIAPNMNISRFNRALGRRNPRLLRELRKYLSGVYGRLPRLGEIEYIIVPSLEDNFTHDAYVVFRELVREVFATERIVRNPLHGNRWPGDGLEVHSYSTIDASRLRPGDIINGDGVESCLATSCNELDFAELRKWVDIANSVGALPVIYIPQIQGLPANIKQGGVSFTPPDKRKYTVHNIKQLRRLIENG